MLKLIPLPIKLLVTLGILVGTFFFGYMKGSSYAEAELQKYAAKASQKTIVAEHKNQEISNKTVIQYVDRTRVIKEKEYVYRDITKTSVPSQYVLSNGWVYTHDISATNGTPDSTRASDATPSGIKDNEALGTITANYSNCNQNKEQLIALQKWITDNIKSINDLNKGKNK
jgi:hypothetical protein